MAINRQELEVYLPRRQTVPQGEAFSASGVKKLLKRLKRWKVLPPLRSAELLIPVHLPEH